MAKKRSSRKDRTIWLNLKYDHRVTDARKEAFHKKYGRYKVESLHRYYKDRIRCAAKPDFVDDNLNGTNEVLLPGVSPDIKFVNVMDLHGLLDVVEWENESDEPIVPFRSLDRKTGDRSESTFRFYSDWLDEHLLESDKFQQKAFVGQLLRVVGKMCQEKGSYNPSWVTHEEAFEEYLGDDGDEYRADRWQCATGLARESGRWLAVIQYSFAELGRKLYRPTQLDAGGYDWHFPSHPRRKVERGGQAMALGKGDYTGRQLLPEFIHTQVNCLDENHVVAVAKTIASSDDGLVQCRLRHRDRLKQINPRADDPKWYPRDVI